MRCGKLSSHKKAEDGGHYGAFVSSGIVGHEGGNLLVSYTLDEINNQFFAKTPTSR